MSDQRIYLVCPQCDEHVLIAKQASPHWSFRNKEKFETFLFGHGPKSCGAQVEFWLEDEMDHYKEGLTKFKAVDQEKTNG